jgi:hypothetical protein
MERKLKFLCGELKRHFKYVRMHNNAAPIESSFTLFRVSNQPLDPEAFAPFVVISVDGWALSQSDADFGKRAGRGIEIAGHILARAPVRDKSYQGTVYIEQDVRYAYQGQERRSGKDRRRIRRKGTDSPDASAPSPEDPANKDERRKRERRSIPQL